MTPKDLPGPPIRDVTLREMLEAMVHYRDDETFRWFQTSIVRRSSMRPASSPTTIS